jgi:phenylacetate-CoA ligase
MGIEFRIRDYFHPVLTWRLWREFKQNPRRPPDELRQRQEQRLREIISRAYSVVPHYRKMFNEAGLKPADIQTLDDLPRLPVLSKQEVISAGSEMRALDRAQFNTVEYHTSGTSGEPLSLLRDKHANALEFVYYWRHWNWADYRLGDAFGMLARRHFLEPRQAGQTSAWQPHLRRLLLNCNLISPATAGAMARELERHGCKFLKAAASAVYHLALSMREAGVRPRRLRAVISTDEPLLPHQRELIGDMFGCHVLDSYGHMEGTVTISQCREGGRHVNTDYGILEFANVRPSSDGSSLLAEGIGTGLHNRVMPFIRYLTGDTFELFREPQACPCGRTFPLIKAIHGRQLDVILTPDGRFVTSLIILPDFVTGFHEIQFVQESATRLVIRVVPGDGFDGREEEKLKAHAMTLTGPSMQVSVQRCAPSELIRGRGGKTSMVIPLQSANGTT